MAAYGDPADVLPAILPAARGDETRTAGREPHPFAIGGLRRAGWGSGPPVRSSVEGEEERDHDEGNEIDEKHQREAHLDEVDETVASRLDDKRDDR